MGTVVHSFKRWDTMLNLYVVQRSRGTAEYVHTLRGEIIPGTEDIVEPSRIDGEGRYIPPSG